ncbi:MAG: hypothetical protein H6550_07495 [Chitinophagales bacterium]|nr:hypothetical protein [Chitinophagales bacterium]
MKHPTLPVTAVILLLVTQSSCIKEYTCECYTTPGKTNYNEYKIRSSSKSRAADNCHPGDLPPPDRYCGLK